MSSKQTGSNGKSTLYNLLFAAFGDYFLNGHPSIITGKIEKAQSAMMSTSLNLKVSLVMMSASLLVLYSKHKKNSNPHFKLSFV